MLKQTQVQQNGHYAHYDTPQKFGILMMNVITDNSSKLFQVVVK